jgi:hypothetical protein
MVLPVQASARSGAARAGGLRCQPSQAPCGRLLWWLRLASLRTVSAPPPSESAAAAPNRSRRHSESSELGVSQTTM